MYHRQTFNPYLLVTLTFKTDDIEPQLMPLITYSIYRDTQKRKSLFLSVRVFSCGSGEHIDIFKIFKKCILGHVSS